MQQDKFSITSSQYMQIVEMLENNRLSSLQSCKYICCYFIAMYEMEFEFC